MFPLGTTEVLLILAIGLLLFGKKLPDLARSFGRAISEFRHEASALTEDLPAAGKRPV